MACSPSLEAGATAGSDCRVSGWSALGPTSAPWTAVETARTRARAALAVSGERKDGLRWTGVGIGNNYWATRHESSREDGSLADRIDELLCGSYAHVRGVQKVTFHGSLGGRNDLT